ncbi:hypothetical protein V8E52_004992 [Russula decolorans]
MVLKYFWYTMSGLYIWEYLTTLHFELDVIRRRRPYRWTIWIYLLARVSTLMAVIINFIVFDTTSINCQALMSLQLTFSCSGLVTASLLIIFRITAIWNKNRLVVGTAIVVWATNVLIAIFLGIMPIRSTWDPVLQRCIVLNTDKPKPSIIAILITDIVLLLIVFIGLLRLQGSGVSFALGRLLWKQGVIWLLIATVAEVPPTVLIILNLNASLNFMFVFPSAIAMSISATRIYRNLADYVHETTDISIDSLEMRDRKITKIKRKPSAPTPLSQVEVTVDIRYQVLTAT